MRRCASLCLALVACGRIGFDRTGDGGSAGDGGDAPLTPDACGLPGLVLYLAFDEDAGTTAADSSGRGHHGALAGFASPAWTTGQRQNALAFDGVDDRVEIGSPAALDDLMTITICAWIESPSVSGSFSTIADKSADGFTQGWNLYLRGTDTLGFFTNFNAYQERDDGFLGAWRHVCASWDGTSDSPGIRLYADGDPLASDRAGGGETYASDASHALTIGRGSLGDYPFTGRLDELRIYDRVLDTSGIAMVRSCSLP